MTKERELLFRIIEQWGNAKVNGTEMEQWLKDYAAESSPVISDKALVLKTRIEERKLCIYLIEQDLLDHVEGDEAYTEDYITALIDEVKNHQNYITDYQSELSKQKEGSNG